MMLNWHNAAVALDKLFVLEKPEVGAGAESDSRSSRWLTFVAEAHVAAVSDENETSQRR